MDFTQSSLWKDAQKVLRNGSFSRRRITAVFHVDGVDYPAQKVEFVDIERDYRHNFSDVLILQATIGMGAYAMRFYPNMDKLECTLSFIPSGQDGEREGYVESPRIERFKAIMLNPSTRAIDLNNSREISEKSLDLTEMATGQFQLINKAVDQLRGVLLGGIYRDCKADEVLVQALTQHSMNVKNVDTDQMPKGVDIVDVTATVKRAHIPIRQGMRLTELPDYLQKECNGIYATGVACYYQGNYWYVFPPFDTSRFNKTKRTLTVINVPAGTLTANERSFYKNGDHTTILATGSSSLTNQSDKLISEAGSGLRFGNAGEFMEDFVDVQGNVALASRGKNVTEYRAIDRPDGNYLVPVSKDRITSNNLQQMSEMAARDGALFTVVWEHAIHDVLEPGMVTRIMYLDNGLARQIDAVLLKVHYYMYSTPGPASYSHNTEATLTFFIQRKQPIHD